MLQNKPAVYMLTSKGSTFLRQHSDQYDAKVLHAIVAGSDPSNDFIERNLAIFSIYNKLKTLYKDDLLFLTKSAMSSDRFHYLPEVKPDAFIQLGEKYFFLYYLSKSTPDFAHVRRFKPVFDYESRGQWQNETDAAFPTVLFVADTKRLATLARKRFTRFAVSSSSDMECTTTTYDSLMSDGKEVWDKDGERTDLTEIQVPHFDQ
jgi:hypothetical protein